MFKIPRHVRLAMQPFIFTFLGIVIFFGLIVIASPYVGWYGYKKWEYRLQTQSVEESKERGVFVRELAYDTANVPVKDFHVYIEKGHHWDKHSSSVYHLIEGSKYPFQLSYTDGKELGYRIFLFEEELDKMDSADAVWGYLKEPLLRDTITVGILSNSEIIGQVKVWDEKVAPQ